MQLEQGLCFLRIKDPHLTFFSASMDKIFMAKLNTLFFCSALFKVFLSSFPIEKNHKKFNYLPSYLGAFLFRVESFAGDYRTLKYSTPEQLLKIPLTTPSCKEILRLPFYLHASVHPVTTAALHFIQKV